MGVTVGCGTQPTRAPTAFVTEASLPFGDAVLGVQDRTSRVMRLHGLWYTIHGGETAGGILIAKLQDTELNTLSSLSFPLS